MAGHGENSVHPLDNSAGYGPNTGITLRQYFAGMVLQGLAANPEMAIEAEARRRNAVKLAIELADTLLAELESPSAAVPPRPPMEILSD